MDILRRHRPRLYRPRLVYEANLPIAKGEQSRTEKTR